MFRGTDGLGVAVEGGGQSLSRGTHPAVHHTIRENPNVRVHEARNHLAALDAAREERVDRARDRLEDGIVVVCGDRHGVTGEWNGTGSNERGGRAQDTTTPRRGHAVILSAAVSPTAVTSTP